MARRSAHAGAVILACGQINKIVQRVCRRAGIAIVAVASSQRLSTTSINSSLGYATRVFFARNGWPTMPKDVRKSRQQKRAEAEVARFREALGPFVTAADTTRMPKVFTDAKASNHPIIYVNQAFLTLTGYAEHEVMGQSFDFLMKRGTDPEMLREIQTSFDGGRGLEPLVSYRCKDGQMVWLLVFITPVRNKDGEVEQHFSSFVNITRQKEEEDRLRVLFSRT